MSVVLVLAGALQPRVGNVVDPLPDDPVGLAFGVLVGEAPPAALAATVPNDLVWWVPFGLILRHAYRVTRSASVE